MSGISEDFMDSREFRGAVSAIRDCALIMLENASFIQQELPNVEMNEALRLQTVEVCESMAGTKHDVLSELFEIFEIIDSKVIPTKVLHRVDLTMKWLWEDILKMDQVVMALRDDSQKNEDHTLSLILVQESAANIVNAFNRAKAAVDALAGEKK